MKKNIILFVAAVIALAGCSDFLDIRTEGSMPSSGIDYSKPENIFLPVSAAYASMRMAEGEAQNYIAVMEVTSDDADKGSSEADGPTVAEFTAAAFYGSSSWEPPRFRPALRNLDSATKTNLYL